MTSLEDFFSIPTAPKPPAPGEFVPLSESELVEIRRQILSADGDEAKLPSVEVMRRVILTLTNNQRANRRTSVEKPKSLDTTLNDAERVANLAKDLGF